MELSWPTYIRALILAPSSKDCWLFQFVLFLSLLVYPEVTLLPSYTPQLHVLSECVITHSGANRLSSDLEFLSAFPTRLVFTSLLSQGWACPSVWNVPCGPSFLFPFFIFGSFGNGVIDSCEPSYGHWESNAATRALSYWAPFRLSTSFLDICC